MSSPPAQIRRVIDAAQPATLLNTYDDSFLFSGFARQIDPGDKAAVSTIIGVYSYASRTSDIMRYTQVLSSTLQALLVKCNRYSTYHLVFERIRIMWGNARTLQDTATGSAQAAVLLAEIELLLKIIAEKESLTANTAELFAGQLTEKPVSVSDSETDADYSI